MKNRRHLFIWFYIYVYLQNLVISVVSDVNQVKWEHFLQNTVHSEDNYPFFSGNCLFGWTSWFWTGFPVSEKASDQTKQILTRAVFRLLISYHINIQTLDHAMIRPSRL